jgi:hypothetical protein
VLTEVDIRGCMANMGGNLESKLKLQDSWRMYFLIA